MKPCHKESNFRTNSKRVCPVCGKVYYYEDCPIDFERVTKGRKKA